MALRFLSDLAGTLNSWFRIAGIRLKNVTDTVLQIRNKADTEYRDVGVRSVDLRRTTGTNKVGLSIGSEPAADIDYKFPVAYGSSGQVLADDGTGQLSWQTVATAQNTVKAQQETILHNSGSSVVIFTPPDGATIRAVLVEVEVAFNGAGVQLSVGNDTVQTLYMGTNQNELDVAGRIFEVAPMEEVGVTPEAVKVFFTAGTGASAGTARVTVEYSLPE